MKKNPYVGFRRCVAVVAGVVIGASLFVPARMSAQNPGLGGGRTASTPPISLQDIPATRSEAHTVRADEVVRDLLLTGELRAARSILIQAPRSQNNFNNTIVYMVDEGAIVNAGDLIVEFDDSDLQNRKSDAELDLETAKLDVAKRRLDLESERANLLNSVVQSEASVKRAELDANIDRSLRTENDYERFQLTLRRAQLQLEKDQQNLDNFEKNYDSRIAMVEIAQSQREIALARIENDLVQLRVFAPQSGIFLYGDNWQSNRKVQVGDSIFPGMEVASIPDLTSMQVVGYVYDTEYRMLSPGMHTEVRFDALPGVVVDGTVESLTNVAGRRGFASTRKMFQATVQLNEVDTELLKPGMTTRINVPMVLAQGVPAVPREYIGLDSQGRSYVLKGTDIRRADTQFITIGAIGDSLIEIASGVSVGERLFPIQ